MRSVLHNFLGTFTSRYSAHDGYWIFGMLVDELDHEPIDLLGAAPQDTNAWAIARRIAQERFREQVAKGGLAISRLREARLDLRRSSAPASGLVNGHMVPGYEVTLAARATFAAGAVYERAMSMFVAPHDPALELRSAHGE